MLRFKTASSHFSLPLFRSFFASKWQYNNVTDHLIEPQELKSNNSDTMGFLVNILQEILKSSHYFQNRVVIFFPYPRHRNVFYELKNTPSFNVTLPVFVETTLPISEDMMHLLSTKSSQCCHKLSQSKFINDSSTNCSLVIWVNNFDNLICRDSR